MTSNKMTIGVVSDTHGLVRPSLQRALAGCEQILHAGDFGAAMVVDQLVGIAPLTGVRGNVDRQPWASVFPMENRFDWAGHRGLLVHNRDTIRTDLDAEAIDIVVFGHSHQPEVTERGGRWWINPGSAGPQRFSLPICCAVMTLEAGRPPHVQHVILG